MPPSRSSSTDWIATKQSDYKQFTPRARRNSDALQSMPSMPSMQSDQLGSRCPESPISLLEPSSPSRQLKHSNSRTMSASAVQVVVRFRPPVTEEEQLDSAVFSVQRNGRSVGSADGSYVFEFNQAFAEAATQDDIFEHVGKPIVSDVLSGYNGTILAYGQTSSGKTHSMFGPGNLAMESISPDLQGIVPRAARHVFDNIEASVDYDTEFTLRCSFMEVYKEKMNDLLRPNGELLRVKELPQRGLFVDGLSREYATCAADVMSVIRAGLRTRVVGRTRCNNYSSRSHVIFVLHVEQQSLQGEERLGKLTLVDLAGSEKVSKSESVGETFEEAKKINWSLSALGKVIDALAEQRSHVPYRDSQLTRVLQEALGGNCRTTLLVAASPFAQHADETLSSLRFAARAKNVRNVAKVNYTYSPEQLLVLVGKLHKQLLGANRHIIQLGGMPQEAPTDEADKCASLCANSSSRSLRRPSTSSKGLEAAAAALAQGDSGSLRLTSAELSEPSEVQKEEEDDLEAEAMTLPLYNEAFVPLAQSAERALSSLEEALLAQEKTLTEARLLRAHREDTGHDRSTPRCSSSGDGRGALGHDADLISERFRALRHAVDARSLQWRLHLEKYRAESLILELDMRENFQKDLESRLAETSAKLAEAEELVPTAFKAKATSSSSTAATAPAARAGPLSAKAADGASAASSREKPRIVRPVPRRRAPGSPRKSQSVIAASLEIPREATSPTASPRGSRLSMSRTAEDVLWVAGTGDTGSEISGAAQAEQSSGTGALGGVTAEAKLSQTAQQAEEAKAIQSMQIEMKGQQVLLDQRGSRLRGVLSELQAKDLQISALRHQIRIKDALLGCLQDEERLRFETFDSELEALLEKALTPLTAILTREQTAHAIAANERVKTPRKA